MKKSLLTFLLNLPLATLFCILLLIFEFFQLCDSFSINLTSFPGFQSPWSCMFSESMTPIVCPIKLAAKPQPWFQVFAIVLLAGASAKIEISPEFETLQPRSGGRPKQFFDRQGSDEVSLRFALLGEGLGRLAQWPEL